MGLRYTHRVEYYGGFGPSRNEGRQEWRIWAFAYGSAQALRYANEVATSGFRFRVRSLA